MVILISESKASRMFMVVEITMNLIGSDLLLMALPPDPAPALQGRAQRGRGVVLHGTSGSGRCRRGRSSTSSCPTSRPREGTRLYRRKVSTTRPLFMGPQTKKSRVRQLAARVRQLSAATRQLPEKVRESFSSAGRCRAAAGPWVDSCRT